MKRRSRLVPKVVFRLAITATAMPAAALGIEGCKDDRQVQNPVACCGYQGVAQSAYTVEPNASDASPPPPQLTVAAMGFTPTAPVVDAALDAKTTDAGAKRIDKP